MHSYTIQSFLKSGFNVNPNNKALTLLDGSSYTYKELEIKISEVKELLVRLDIKKGDKVSIVSKNCPNWGVTYLAITFLGAVVVPILNDFSKKEILNILNHSESKVLFISSNLIFKFEGVDFESIKTVVNIENFDINEKLSINTKLNNNKVEEVDIDANDLAAILYTSGTTSASKGVMLSHKNLVSNTIACNTVQPTKVTDRFLSILPLPHTYECTLGLFLPLSAGACVYYMNGQPTISVLKNALQVVRPTFILSVPLIIEKIYRKSIHPALYSGFKKILCKFPPLRIVMSRVAGKKLIKFFGGEIRFFGIGGALLDKNVEKFLLDAKFPYAIGYGLTETSPLLAGCSPNLARYRSTGFVVEGMKLKLRNVNPKTKVGEVLAKGDCVMLGYYKNEEITKQTFTDDGWFITGDMGYLDKDNYLYLKGRLKNVIVGSTGENIYPEEIESVLNDHHFVLESIVYEFKGKLIAKVYLDMEAIESSYKQIIEGEESIYKEIEDFVGASLSEIQGFVNENVSKLSKLTKIIEQKKPFIKTPTHKIKKYLYTKDNHTENK